MPGPNTAFAPHISANTLVLNQGTAPTTPPFKIAPSAAPTETGEGFMYFDSTTHSLKAYNGSAWEEVGLSPAGNLTVGGTLAVTGATTLNGAVTLGDASGDAVTVTGTPTLSAAAVGMTSDSLVLTLGTTAPVTLTKSADALTVGSGDTLAVTTADKLTVGGIIIPQYFYITHNIRPMATITEYDIFVCIDAFEVVAMRVVPSTLQGGAATATLVKAVSTATPVKTTTPLHTADAIDLNAGAYTVQTITPTATGADLQFAAGNRLGIDFSTAITAAHAAVTIKCKRI